METIAPHTWWLTGLPCAGKSTLANALAAALRARDQPVCILDGDELREGVSRDLGFSPADREEQARRTAEMAKLVNRNGIHTIVALVSPTRSARAQARHIIGVERFSEIYIATPLAVCQKRDSKGWYARAVQDASLSLTGLTAPYEVPEMPDLVIDSSCIPLEKAVELLLMSQQRFVDMSTTNN